MKKILATIGLIICIYLILRGVFDIGLTDHIIFVIIPLIYLFFYYNINLYKYKPTILTFITLIYLLSYKYLDQILYKTGKDL